jgi:hypothetical protein
MKAVSSNGESCAEVASKVETVAGVADRPGPGAGPGLGPDLDTVDVFGDAHHDHDGDRDHDQHHHASCGTQPSIRHERPIVSLRKGQTTEG